MSSPCDYAFLAQFAAASTGHDVEGQTQKKLLNGNEDAITRTACGAAPQPNTFFISPTPTAMVYRPTENTPLLSPPNPRIEEDVDCSNERNGPSTWVMFQEELGVLAKYTLPIFATHVFEYSLNMASVVAIGHISTIALAAATLGFMTASVSGYAIVQGLASALDTLLPAAWTSNHPQLVGLWSQRMLVVTAATLIPVLMIWFNAESILLLLRQDPEVAHLAGVYLKWSSLGLPAYAFNCISRRYFQSQGLFSVPTKIILFIAPINALLNYVFVWGPEPLRIGFIGAPIATSISLNLISISSVIYGIFYVERTAWHPISWRSFTGLSCLVKLGLAGVGQTASEWWSWELNNLAASLLGPAALAAQSVLLISSSCTFQAPFALSLATSVRIGNLLGEKKARRAGVSAYASIALSVGIALVWSTLFMTFRQSWAYIVNNDPEVVTLVASILPLVAVYQVFDGITAVTGGILRARGKQFIGALLNLSAYYVIGIPFGVWLTFKMNMGLVGLWVGITVSLIYCSFWGTYLCITADWQKDVQKVLDRLAVESKNVH
ncbi:MATE efflux family protein [Suillus clintonianus]|uniref:MATE efflux family protein n=1 Tax=Suillus clintonianus TaxID=1904413 RepID=UPI001B880B7C|nr:MATE efflux family protein [Suillus clintonianus]KAG2140585.1 MATE efflux family protein [Suillus clintonianus]